MIISQLAQDVWKEAAKYGGQGLQLEGGGDNKMLERTNLPNTTINAAKLLPKTVFSLLSDTIHFKMTILCPCAHNLKNVNMYMVNL